MENKTIKSQEEKFAELFISMSTDFLLKKISLEHYANTLNMVNEQFQQMLFEDESRKAEEDINDFDNW